MFSCEPPLLYGIFLDRLDGGPAAARVFGSPADRCVSIDVQLMGAVFGDVVQPRRAGVV